MVSVLGIPVQPGKTDNYTFKVCGNQKKNWPYKKKIGEKLLVLAGGSSGIALDLSG